MIGDLAVYNKYKHEKPNKLAISNDKMRTRKLCQRERNSGVLRQLILFLIQSMPNNISNRFLHQLISYLIGFWLIMKLWFFWNLDCLRCNLGLHVRAYVVCTSAMHLGVRQCIWMSPGKPTVKWNKNGEEIAFHSSNIPNWRANRSKTLWSLYWIRTSTSTLCAFRTASGPSTGLALDKIWAKWFKNLSCQCHKITQLGTRLITNNDIN